MEVSDDARNNKTAWQNQANTIYLLVLEHLQNHENANGIIPKLVMLEGALSIDAKALYAYFCAYAGSNVSCYPPKG